MRKQTSSEKQALQKVLSIKYVKLIRLMMNSVGAWPGPELEGRPRRFKFYSYFLIFEAMMLGIGAVMYIHTQFYILPFFALGNVYITLTLTFIVFYRSILPCLFTYGDIFREFLTKFHLVHFKRKGEYWVKLANTIDRISYMFTMSMIILSSIGVATFSLTPVYQNYRVGYYLDDRPENMTVEFSIHYQYPGFKQEKHVTLCTVLNIWFAFATAFMLCTLDLFLCLMVFQIIGHIKTLRHTLRNFPQPKEVKLRYGPEHGKAGNGRVLVVETVQPYDDQENEIIKNMIKECVEHHLFIVSFTARISSFFGPLLAFNYMYHLVGLSVLFVEVMEGGDAIMRYGPLTAMTVTQLTQLSVTFEIVGSESERLRDEVYGVPWESMNVSNMKSIGFLLKRVQTSIAVTALGMTSVGVQTMGSILKTSCSYCAFLRTLD